jgi:hypothetical protein
MLTFPYTDTGVSVRSYIHNCIYIHHTISVLVYISYYCTNKHLQNDAMYIITTQSYQMNDRMVIVFTFTYAIKCRHLKWSVLFHSMESFARYNFIIKFFSGLQPVGDFHGEGVFRFPRPISQKYCY